MTKQEQSGQMAMRIKKELKPNIFVTQTCNYF